MLQPATVVDSQSQRFIITGPTSFQRHNLVNMQFLMYIKKISKPQQK